MSRERVLITGITGFAGSHLAEYLLHPDSGKDYEISGTYVHDQSLLNAKTFPKSVRLFKVELKDAAAVSKLIMDVRPDYVYHLAAQAAPKLSFGQQQAADTMVNNTVSQLNLLEALRLQGRPVRFLVVGSADEYGKVPEDANPVSETQPFNPTNPYAVSKVAQDMLGLQYFNTYGMPIVRVRPFNHIGPRQAPNFVVSEFAKRIAEIMKDPCQEPVVRVGNLSPARDFTSVLDMVRAYELALLKGVSGEVYNIGSGVSITIRDMLNALISFSSKEIKVVEDPGKLRKKDFPKLESDSTRFRSQTGWKPKVTFKEALRSVFDYWMNVV